jgi:hypothetical protein
MRYASSVVEGYMSSIIGSIKAALSTSVGQAVAAATAGMIGLPAAALSPLGDRVSHWIWPEKLQISQTETVYEETPRSLHLVVTDTGGSTGISGGTIALHPESDAVELQGQTTFTYGKSPGSQDIDTGVKVVAHTLGSHTLNVDVVSNEGNHFQGKVVITSQPRRAATSLTNLTGSYQILLNGAEGSMELIQRNDTNGNFVGSANVSGEEFKAKGWHDGVGFHLTLTDQATLTYQARGVWCVLGSLGYRFIVVNAKVTTLKSGVVTPNPHLLDDPDRCPNFSKDMADDAGDGSFSGSVPLSN